MEDTKEEAQPIAEETTIVPVDKLKAPRGPDGKFLSKKAKLSTERYEIERREFLQGKESGSKISRAAEIDRELFTLVKLGKTDPKFASAAVNAAKQLADRSFRRVAPSEIELDRLTAFPISMVIITHPEGLKTAEEKPKGPRRPNFAEEVPGSANTIEGEYQK